MDTLDNSLDLVEGQSMGDRTRARRPDGTHVLPPDVLCHLGPWLQINVLLRETGEARESTARIATLREILEARLLLELDPRWN